MQIISRQLAIARGDSFYFTGKPCKYNHIEKRRTRDTKCLICAENYNKKYKAQYKLKYPERLKEQRKKTYNKNKKKVLAVNKTYRDKHKKRLKKLSAKYRKNNKHKRNEHEKNLRKNNVLHALRHKCRVRIRDAFKRNGYTKGAKRTTEMLGCDWATLKLHIESKFLEGMTWENRRLWHIDHIVPYAAAETEADIIRLSHYTNLQPLWAKDNLKKGAKLHYDPTPTRTTK